MPWTFFDSSGRKLNTASTSVADLDIDGATDIGAAIVDADLFIIDDGAGGTNRKTAASRLKTYAGVTQAVQSDIEAETNQDTYIPPDLLKHHPGVAKFWVDIDHSSGSPVIDGDYNVASLDDNGTGNTDINYTVAFADAHYAVVCMGSYTGAYVNIIGESVTYHTTTYQRILCIRNSASNAGVDINGAFVAGFGDQ